MGLLLARPSLDVGAEAGKWKNALPESNRLVFLKSSTLPSENDFSDCLISAARGANAVGATNRRPHHNEGSVVNQPWLAGRDQTIYCSF